MLGATMRSFRDNNTLLSLLFTSKFFPRVSSKIILNYFQLFEMKVLKAKCGI